MKNRKMKVRSQLKEVSKSEKGVLRERENLSALELLKEIRQWLLLFLILTEKHCIIK